MASLYEILAQLDAMRRTAGRNLSDLFNDPRGYAEKVVGHMKNQNAMVNPVVSGGELTNRPMSPSERAEMATNMLDIGGGVGKIVYHGSPHKFAKFDKAKIGTGEGAQAYGKGAAYLAEAPEVADQYRINLSYDPSQMKIGGKQINAYHDAITRKADRMNDPGDLYDKAGIVERLMANEPVESVASWAKNLGVGDWFEKEVRPGFQSFGHMYKADIPDEAVAKFLDWDKPLHQQPKEVQKALKNLGVSQQEANQQAVESAKKQFRETGDKADYQEMHRLMNEGRNIMGSDIIKGNILQGLAGKAPEEALAAQGVPGIRYLDAASREGGGTSNFVPFDENLIRILERNGEATGQKPWAPGEWGTDPTGQSTMLLSGGRGTSRTPGSIPEAVNLPGFHWSNEPNLMQTSPGRYGTGIKGAEAERLAANPDIRPRTYFYTNDTAREAGLGSNQYRGELKDVYPASDPLGLMKGDANEFERAVKAKGFKGYEGDGAAVYFDPVAVAPHTGGVAPAPRPAAAEITDTTEVLAGDRARHALGAEQIEPYQQEMMQWLQRSNRIYPKLGFPGRDEMAIGRYTTPEGKVEFNPVNAYSIPHSPGAEEAVGLWNAMKAPLLAQNARGASGVADAPGAPGMRFSAGGGTQDQFQQMMAELEGKGIYSAPTGSGISAWPAGEMSANDLYAATHDAARAAGVPKAEAYVGNARTFFDELPWGAEGTGQVTEQYIVPKLLENPDLMRRLDLTGEPQQLARGLNAADRRLADRFGIQGRADVQSLRDTVAMGGLEGILARVRKGGYAGLPAAGFLTLDPERERYPY